MKTLHISLLSMATVALIYASGCGDSGDDNPDPAGTPSSASSSSTTASSSASSAGTGGAGGTGGSGGTGGAPLTCPTGMKTVENVTGNITADRTLASDKDYLLQGIVYVQAPATLTIEPCTMIMGEKSSLATLVVQPGAKIHAVGEPDRPIVFTSEAPAGNRLAGDWGGVVLLGKAPINQGTAYVEGIPPTPETAYGGTDPMDDSGIMQYVRIEFSGILLSMNNEVNGLTFGGVGAGTRIDHIQVRHTLDDCFEFFGGTVNGHHLICQYNQDDGFDFDFGYAGKLQFLALQQDPAHPGDDNGIETDNDANSSTMAPLTDPTIYNATFCGKNMDLMGQQFGILSRRSSHGQLNNAVVTGFESCWDTRDPQTSWQIKSSICFGNVAAGSNIAYVESPTGTGTTADDDMGFDEVMAFNDPAHMNVETDPRITDCFNPTPDFRPMTTITTNAATPPNDGFFDPSATYIGAFDQTTNWATGIWVSFTPN